jgi:lysozyme family protein
VYRREYWDALQAEALPEAIRFDLFDAAVNSGCTQAIKWLQSAVGVHDDGLMGPLTMESSLLTSPGVILARFNGQRLEFMTNLPTWTAFGKGWARRIAKNLKGV